MLTFYILWHAIPPTFRLRSGQAWPDRVFHRLSAFQRDLAKGGEARAALGAGETICMLSFANRYRLFFDFGRD